MALMASCWLIVDFFLIPRGFLKWFYLGFYVHPFFLVFCQIFLWLKEFQEWLLLLLSFPLKIAFRVCLFIFQFGRAKVENVVVVIDVVSCSSPCHIINKPKVQSEVCPINLDTCKKEDSWLNEYLSSDHFISTCLTYDLDSNESLFSTENSSSFSSSSPNVDFQLQDSNIDSINTFNYLQPHQEISNFSSFSELEDSPSSIINNQEIIQESDEYSENIISSHSCDQLFVDSSNELHLTISTRVQEDTFHHKYIERMGFFNVLYHERLYGMNAILNEDSAIIQSLEDSSRKGLLRSLECDFELIYVAQLCLFWEGLNHQYLKLLGNCEINLFHHSVAGKFQELQILLERFVENQKLESQISSNTHRRLSFQCLLLVPDVTGFIEDENNGTGIEGEAVRASRVLILIAIEKCIEAFHLYIQTDEKKPHWKYKCTWRTQPPLEDPLDLKLLHNVSQTLHKKEMMLKYLQGKKKKNWLSRKMKPLETNNEKRIHVFAAVDIKLIQRILKMSLISKSQLEWCRDKLNNLEFEQGTVFRVPTSHLFPSL
ncbi:hypothetical protein ACP275_11G123200 [Erythranthe tilingii]